MFFFLKIITLAYGVEGLGLQFQEGANYHFYRGSKAPRVVLCVKYSLKYHEVAGGWVGGGGGGFAYAGFILCLSLPGWINIG